MLEWTVDDVIQWLKSVGFGAFERRFRENHITGDVLARADHDMLKELDIKSVGQRISLLKALYNLKLSKGIPFEDDDYIPEEARTAEKVDPADYQRMRMVVRQQEHSIQQLTGLVERLSNELATLKHDMSPVWAMVKEYEEFEQKKQSKSKSTLKLGRSTSKSTSKAPAVTPLKKPSNHDIGGSISTPQRPIPSPTKLTPIRIYTDRQLNREHESYKTISIANDDTCYEILPEILRKYKILSDWQHYGLFFRYQGIERCLNLDERPAALLRDLPSDGEQPVFTLKHLKQFSSPASRLNHLTPVSDDTPPTAYVSDVDGQGPKAVAIYEYQAALGDELDLVIGDHLRILRQGDDIAGWCVVEKSGRIGWVPEGCLARSGLPTASPEASASEKGVALYDYHRVSANELSIRKGDELIIRNRAEHWLYGECNGESGWVPAAYVSSLDSNNEDTLGNDDPHDLTFQQGLPANNGGSLPRKQSRHIRGQSDGNAAAIMRKESIKDADMVRPSRSRSNTVGTAVSKLADLIDSLKDTIDVQGPKSAPVGKMNASMRLSLVLQEIVAILQTFKKDAAEESLEDRLQTSLELVTVLASHVDTNMDMMKESTKYGQMLDRLEAVAEEGKETLAQMKSDALASPVQEHGVLGLQRKKSIAKTYEALSNAIDIIMQDTKRSISNPAIVEVPIRDASLVAPPRGVSADAYSRS
ncbi:hypothetical protein BC832DRAFT_592041 [Gaertneriomyces semiglobifer]|nr:hypothetical protein BC832DRAFT_592041 [Gaertneriomyces semiglobifer]